MSPGAGAGSSTIVRVCANVIVAEDDEKQAELVRRYLEHEGHAVTVVGDGLAALAEVRHRSPICWCSM